MFATLFATVSTIEAVKYFVAGTATAVAVYKVAKSSSGKK